MLPMSSGDAVGALARGWDASLDGAVRPQVWLPGASSWLSLLRATSSPASALLPVTSPSYAQSPLVIAMPRPIR